MKRGVLAAITMVALAAAANLSAGEQSGNPGQAATKPGGTSGGIAPAGSNAGGGGAAWYIQYVDKIVKLTDDQKKAMNQIIEARDRAMKDFQAENAEKIKAAGKAVVETYRSNDKDAVAKAQRAYQDLYAPMHEMMRKSQADLARRSPRPSPSGRR